MHAPKKKSMDIKDAIVKQEKNDTKFTQKPGVAYTPGKNINSCSQSPDINTVTHGQLRLRDLLRFVGDPCREIGLRDGKGRGTVDDAAYSNPTARQTCLVKEEELCAGNSCTRGVRKSLSSEFSAGAAADVPANDGKRNAPQTVSKLASDNFLPELFHAATTYNQVSEKEGAGVALGRRSHSIIAHILTGEDKILGAGTYSPDRHCNNEPEAVKYPGSCPGSPEDLRSDEDQFIEDSLCDALNVDKLDGEDQWEVDAAVAVCPVKEMKNPPSSQEYDYMGASDHDISMCSTLLIQEISESDDLMQDISTALGTNMIKVVTPQEAMDFCNAEVFCMIWIRIQASSQDEITSLVSAIRFSSKNNKGAHFIAVLGTKQEDVQLHGFDDVYKVPIPKETIRQKYKKVNWITNSETMGADNSLTTRDAVTTPESTISVESIRTSEGSQSSNCDSVSELTFPEFKHSHSDNMGSLSDASDQLVDRSSALPPQSPPPSWCRAEHASKEKQRRERIKDSCDQLRVLLPYVRGRKTDMASILEMTVDYLKIVNAALPQDFQSQVIELMSHGGPPVDGKKSDKERMSMACKKMSRLEAAPLDTASPVFCPSSRKSERTTSAGVVPAPRSASNAISQESSAITGNLSNQYGGGLDNFENIKSCNSPPPAQNALSNLVLRNANGASFLKRARPVESEDADPKRPKCTLPKSTDASNSPEYLPAAGGSMFWEKRRDPAYDEQSPRDMRPHITGLQLTHTLTDGDNPAAATNRMFPVGHVPNTDQYPYQHHPQINLSAPQGRVPPSDRDAAPYGNLYFDGYYHSFYPSFSEPSNPGYCATGPGNEYVNPNAVLPVTPFNPRVNCYPPGHKQERSPVELDRFRGSEKC